ncbi:unnamed protein product, partial [Urochloa humidicola]
DSRCNNQERTFSNQGDLYYTAYPAKKEARKHCTWADLGAAHNPECRSISAIQGHQFTQKQTYTEENRKFALRCPLFMACRPRLEDLGSCGVEI